MIQNFDWPGARWWKFDFHAHTPASEQDYGKGMNHKPGPKEWLLDYMKAGIDCVAITDHNTGDWVDKLKHAYDALKNENHPEFRELYIFPGVELSVMGNVHILGIFPQETSSAEINSIVDRCGFRAKKGTSNAVTDQSLATVLDEIVNKSKGLAIPAHVDDDRGIFKQLQGNDLRPILKSKHIHVVESTQLEINYPAMYHELKLKWTPVLGSDQHYPTGSNENKYPGSHYTWIKMSTPGFEGLCLALMDGNLSVIRSIECKKDPNQFAKERIESICIENAKYMGRTKQFEFRLNPWLNTIIGGRGTGKSTLIEFIRLLFRREQELPVSLKDLFEKYFQIDENQNDEGLLTQNSILSAIYKKYNYQYKIEWRADGVQPSIYEKSSSGQWIPSQGDICQRFPICIYSQKQIFEMARYPESLMNIVDASLTSICFKDWDQLRNQMEGQYISLMSKVRELSNKIKQIPIIQGELDDISRKLEIFEQSQYSDLLKQYQSAKRQEQAIEDWENSWAEAGQILMRASEDIIPDDIEMNLFNAEDDEDDVLIEFDSSAH